ncbi:ABC transporter substrate-binding protein [Streptomyces sp. TRM66268-LWL]|uniref:ABC transporter substrate-binding protein n=1 Tax=Streptomyces polyasparticus TaxID=2767826 RepID=A0ABR7SJ06_9ACTN|nr:ABC transporter substrate-binding protein [Streptomyces polyasparticus]MBC9715249.1 ABC transporter substrate-binding protein [Streptomyces polyasparticus]
MSPSRTRVSPAARPSISRRGLLATGAALGLGTLLAACGDSKDAKSPEKKAGWSFKDDRGKTVRTDGTPKNVVAYIGAASALYDFGVECVGVFGPTKLENGKPDVQAGRIDVDKVEIIGNVWGEFSVEKYAALEPGLLVSTMNVSPTLWYVPEESAEKIAAVAPSVGILTGMTSLTGVIDRFGELAASLGADLKAKKVTDAKARFEAASESVRQAAKTAKAKKLKVMAVSATKDQLYVGTPEDFTDLRHYRELGVDFVTPEKIGQAGFFEELSWENAGKYEADLILVDKRTGNLQPEDLMKSMPTWSKLPAAKAGQTVAWFNEPQFSHAGIAPLLESLATALQDAKKVA